MCYKSQLRHLTRRQALFAFPAIGGYSQRFALDLEVLGAGSVQILEITREAFYTQILEFSVRPCATTKVSIQHCTRAQIPSSPQAKPDDPHLEFKHQPADLEPDLTDRRAS